MLSSPTPRCGPPHRRSLAVLEKAASWRKASDRVISAPEGAYTAALLSGVPQLSRAGGMSVMPRSGTTRPIASPGRTHGRLETAALVAVALVTVLALAAPWITPYDPYLRVAAANLPPGWPHPFGTDEAGEIFSAG